MIIWTPKKLVRELCRREGLKKQVDIAQMSEIVGHLGEILAEGNLICGLSDLGEKRIAKREAAKARKKKARKRK